MYGRPVFLDDLTVFVISSGEETEADCMSALAAQDCAFRVEHIRDVAPMSAAFQAMPDQCETPYFVQLDADMILEPHAIRALYDAVKCSPFWIYRIAGTLFEEGFGIGGAVKCWKKSVFRLARFHDCRTVDRDFHRRVRRFGPQIRRIDDVLGIHRPRHSDFSLYLKTKADVEKWRFLKRPSPRYALPLFNEILDTRESQSHRLLGALLGALTGPERLIRSKDTPFELRYFDKIVSLLGGADIFGQDLSIDRTVARKQFASCYDAFLNQDEALRKPLADLVIALYGARDIEASAVARKLLQMADQ